MYCEANDDFADEVGLDGVAEWITVRPCNDRTSLRVRYCVWNLSGPFHK
jgi:hypothetical protein